MSINHYSAKTSSSNHKNFFSSDIILNSSANPANFWASNATSTAAAGAMNYGQSAAFTFNLKNEDESEELQLEEQAAAADERETNTTSTEFEREKLFEKPLTPSDVGKLNRLVIPKQHAEKYFPLNGGDSGENGLLLGFEDEAGKSWRFRYSYWNSSQSYVLTKGWSRFVKEKGLDAGDIVLFARHRKDVGRLFIGWRRRYSGGGQESGVARPPLGGGGGGGWSGVVYPGHPYPVQHQGSSSVLYQTDCPPAEEQTRSRSGNSKRLRLFGVNLEWSEDDSEPSMLEGSTMSSQGRTHQHPYHQYFSNHHHMDMNFSGGDVHHRRG